MNRAPGGLDSNQFAATLIDRAKRPLIAELIGQGFVVAYQTIVQNREATERIADELVEKGELYGDDVTSPARRRGAAQARDRRARRGDMAGDLIPPPSPAGRPPPDSMADVRATVYLEEATHLAEDADAGHRRAVAVPRPLRLRLGRARRHRRVRDRARRDPRRRVGRQRAPARRALVGLEALDLADAAGRPGHRRARRARVQARLGRPAGGDPQRRLRDQRHPDRRRDPAEGGRARGAARAGAAVPGQRPQHRRQHHHRQGGPGERTADDARGRRARAVLVPLPRGRHDGRRDVAAAHRPCRGVDRRRSSRGRSSSGPATCSTGSRCRCRGRWPRRRRGPSR